MAIELKGEEASEALLSLQQYLRENFEEEAGELKAKLLLDYFLKEVGPFAYNQGVRDAERYFRAKLEDLPGSCHEHPLTYWDR